MITFNNQTKQVQIKDNYKARLQSSRVMCVAILLLSIGKLTIIDYQNIKELDYLFFVITAVFLYLSYKNFLVNTSIETIDKFEIKYVKMPKVMGTRAIIKLNNGKVREVYGLKTPQSRLDFKKLFTDAKIRVI
ncbi:hypothetical protein ACYSNX_08030 [Myroides sp. LJL115]